jgi:hypothetical protein
MSYNNILKLAQKFSVKIANEEKQSAKEYFEIFKSELRAVLNEMEGDLLTLRVKSADRSILKELSSLHQNILSKFKNLDNDQPRESMENVLLYLFSKNVKPGLIILNTTIQKFLQENEIDFAPHSSFSQAKIESINKLFKLARVTENILSQNTKSNDFNTEQLKSEKEEYSPSAGAVDVTKVGKKLFNIF